MVRVRCESSGKLLEVSDDLAGQSVNCPACKGTHPVPGRQEVQSSAGGTGREAPSAASPPRVAPDHGLCSVHPEIPALGKCSRCRKALCETCAFRSQSVIYCSDCASKPSQEGVQEASAKGGWSIACGIGAFAVMAIDILAVMFNEYDGPIEIMDQVLTTVSVGLALGGIALGLMSRDPVRPKSVFGLVGLIMSGIVLGIWGLLILAGIFVGV